MSVAELKALANKHWKEWLWTLALVVVRFTPKSRHVRCTRSCPLWANSGHFSQPFLVARCLLGSGQLVKIS
jgi:hypothetical protein